MTKMLRQRLGLLGQRLSLFLAVLGPGLITASADNDASGIATYSMAGSSRHNNAIRDLPCGGKPLTMGP